MKTPNKITLMAMGLTVGFLAVAGLRWVLLRDVPLAPQVVTIVSPVAPAMTAATKADELEVEKMKSLAAIHRDPVAGSRKRKFVANEPFQYFREVAVYGKLRAKVFLKEEDKAAKRAIFANRELLEGIGEFLKHSAGSDYDAQVQQTTAIDLLLDAAKTDEGREAAEEALHDIIADNQIENESLQADARKNLAGVKAEVLFQWSAQDPSKTKVMQAWLPGPVSAKIWENVTDAQVRNLHESAMVGIEDAQ